MRERWWYVGAGAAVVVAVFAAVHWPLAVPIALGLAAFLAVAALKPNFIAPALVLVALPLMRPNTLGEHNQVSLYALGLCVVAALVALMADRTRFKMPRPFVIVTVMVVLMYLWMAEATTLGGSSPTGSLWQGLLITGGTVACIGFVCSDPRRLLIVGRLFVWLILAMCASYVVTAIAWRVFGVGAFPLATFSVDAANQTRAVLYFPFTPTFGIQTIAGVQLPRFTGLGREPGWMGLYCAVALLIWGRVGKPRWVGRMLLLAGLLGTFSTAAFGAFAVALGVAWIARSALQKNPVLHYFGLLFKLGFLAAALWVAVYAPVLGYADKGNYNRISLDDRTQATLDGLAAITAHPLGGATATGGINLVAAIAPYGVPFALIVIGALILPRIGHPAKHLTTAPIFVIFVTLLLSQPAADSTFMFVLVGLVYGLARLGQGDLLDERPPGAVVRGAQSSPHEPEPPLVAGHGRDRVRP